MRWTLERRVVWREDASDSTRQAFDANVLSGVSSSLILDDAFRYAKRGYKLDKSLITTRKKGYQSSISHLMILLLLSCKLPPGRLQTTLRPSDARLLPILVLSNHVPSQCALFTITKQSLFICDRVALFHYSLI
mmetsp:Transcript_15551/g.37295  ORF Transcript_15551/g.37295 Transcript_15551/m.37295 type:complete len:134 (+) Transcript_15551:3-404(+)